MQTELTSRVESVAVPRLHPGQHNFTVYGRDSAGRAELESRIRAGFGIHFGAHIDDFMPELACYRDPRGASAVVGMRCAADEPLFLETYLQDSIEEIARRSSGRTVSRARIVEVGQFVVDDRDAVAGFFRSLVPFLRSRRFQWVCFTGTRIIRTRLARIGFHGLELTSAAEEDLGASGDAWGTYYDNEPVVTLGKLDDPTGEWFRPTAGHPMVVAAAGV